MTDHREENRRALVLAGAIAGVVIVVAVIGGIFASRDYRARQAEDDDYRASHTRAEPLHLPDAPASPAAPAWTGLATGAHARIHSDTGPVLVSRRPDRAYDEDAVGRLPAGTEVVVLEENDHPIPVGPMLVRYRVVPAGKKAPNGWVTAWALGIQSTPVATGPVAAAPATPAAPEQLPPGVVTLKANTLITMTEPQLDRAEALVAAGDEAAFELYVRSTPGVIIMPGTPKVSIVETPPPATARCANTGPSASTGFRPSVFSSDFASRARVRFHSPASLSTAARVAADARSPRAIIRSIGSRTAAM